MVYELWELAAGNRIGEYETEADALREVLGAIRLYGAELAKRALEADLTAA